MFGGQAIFTLNFEAMAEPSWVRVASCSQRDAVTNSN